MNEEAYELIICQNARFKQEQRILFFRQKVPMMAEVYSRYYMMHRSELFREQTYNFRQVILKEGDHTDQNFYLIQEGQVIVKRKIEMDEKGDHNGGVAKKQ